MNLQTEKPTKPLKALLDEANAQVLASEKKQAETPQSPQIDPTALEGLNALDRDQLLTLCRRMACQCGLVAMMTEEETAQAMLDVLADTALKPLNGGNIKADITSRMNAIDKWLDRTKGKSPVSLNIGGQKDNPVLTKLEVVFVCAQNQPLTIEG